MFQYSCSKEHIRFLANYIVCHFGATYMDGMTGDLLLYFEFLKGILQ